MIERCGDRQRKYEGLERWPFKLFIESLPVMLQVSLLLLACGLCRHMWSINVSVAYILITLTVLGVLFYLWIVYAGTSSYECPFQTPASDALHGLWRKIQPHTIPPAHPIVATSTYVFQVLVSNILHPLWKRALCPVVSTILHYKQVTVQVALNFGQWICTVFRSQQHIHHRLSAVSLGDAQETPHISREGYPPSPIRAWGTNGMWGSNSPTHDINPPHHSTNSPHHSTNPSHHSPHPSHHSPDSPHNSSDSAYISSHGSYFPHDDPLRDSHSPAHAPWLTQESLAAIQKTNTNDIRCVSWILRNITDPEALDAAIRLASMIQWFEDGFGIEPPYHILVSIFQTCLDSTGAVYSGLLDRAYHSAQAVLWIHICAMSKSEEFANNFPLPPRTHPGSIFQLLLGNFFHVDTASTFTKIFIKHNTPTHMQWASKALLQLCKAKQDGPHPLPVDPFSVVVSVPWDTIPLDAILNLFLVWSMHLGSIVEEEALKVQDKMYVIFHSPFKSVTKIATF